MNKRTFDLILVTTVGFKLAWMLPKLWALRTSAEPGNGPMTKLAEAVVIAS